MQRRRKAILPAIAMLFAAPVLMGQREPILVPEVSQSRVEVRQGFTGANLLLYGAVYRLAPASSFNDALHRFLTVAHFNTSIGVNCVHGLSSASSLTQAHVRIYGCCVYSWSRPITTNIGTCETNTSNLRKKGVYEFLFCRNVIK